MPLAHCQWALLRIEDSPPPLFNKERSFELGAHLVTSNEMGAGGGICGGNLNESPRPVLIDPYANIGE